MFSFFKSLFGSTKPSPPTTSREVTKVFLELFHAHALPCTLKDGWIVADSVGMAAQARIHIHNSTPQFTTVQLDVEVRITTGQTILESCGGHGDNLQQAVSNAVINFCNGSFHPIHSAVTGQPCSHCDLEHWEINAIPRRVWLGSMVTLGIQPTQDGSSTNWFHEILPHIKALPLRAGTHWLRIYHADLPGSSSTNEVLLDNDECIQLQNVMPNLSWPATDRFQSTRLFLIIQDA